MMENKILKSCQGTLDGVRILVAEDNDSNYLLLKHILKDSILKRAVNGQEVVEFAKDGVYDLILMDMRMPILDGCSATGFIRKFNDKIPIIALTANAFDSDREKALSEGCSDYITKPIRKQQLVDVILNWLK